MQQNATPNTLTEQIRIAALLVALVTTFCIASVGPVGAVDTTDSSTSVLDGMAGSGTQEDPYEITNASELQAMNEDLDGHYVLANDIDASETGDWNSGDGFEPVGSPDTPFTGTFDGQNHTITGLTIDRPTESGLGLFGEAQDGATIQFVHLRDVDVRGYRAVSGLLAAGNEVTITGASVGGTVQADGALAGGVAGAVVDSTVRRSHATVAADANRNAGVLAGRISGSTVRLSSAAGEADGERVIGGLVGIANEGSTIERSYASGTVSGTTNVGGLLGENRGSELRSSYSAAAVSGEKSAGAIVGSNEGNAADLYWDETVAGVGASTGTGDAVGTGLTTDEMTGPNARSNMGALEFDLVWSATDHYPVLRSEVGGVSLSAPEQVITDQPATATVSLSLVDGRSVAATETADYSTNQSFLSLDSGRFDTSGTGIAEATATVAGHSDSATVSVVTPPDISIENSALRYDRVGSETAAPVDVTLTNDGGADGEFDVVLSINGTTEQTRTVTVSGHSTTTVQLNYSAPATGAYPVAVNGTSLGELTVVEEPETTVTLASLSESLLAVGNTTTVEATIENAGDAAAGHAVELTAGGETVATEDVVVPADGTTVSFDYTADSTGEYDLAVSGTSAGTLTVAEMGSVSVESVSVPESVDAGASYEVTVTLANSGGLPLSTDVAYSVGGSSIGTERVEVPADGTTVTFEATAPQDSESVDHTVTAGDAEWTGSTTVDMETATAGSSGDESNGDSAGDGDGESNDGDGVATTSGDGPGFGVGTALVALLALLATTRYRRR